MEERRNFFFCGGVRAELAGQDQERFFNIAAQRDLSLYRISSENGTVTFWTTPSELKRMKQIVKKTGVKLRIIDRYGLPFLLHKNRKRKLLAAGFFLFFLLLYTLTFYIWDISFEGNHKFTDETLLHYMETIPVTFGMKKKEISCEALEGELRNQFPEITWVSAELRGTRLMIRIRENEVLSAPKERTEEPCDLAAERAGTIVKIIVRSGFSKVKAGEQVEAGTLLVDGTIPIYDDSETLINSHEVHSDAEIYAETIYSFEKRLPLLKMVRYRTGKERSGGFVRIGKQAFYLMPPENTGKKWEFVSEERQLKLFRNFYLPVWLGRLKAYEYDSYEDVYTKDGAFLVCQEAMMEYMEKLSEKGIQILGNNGKIEKGESGWEFEGTITGIEDIAKEVPVPEKQEEIQIINERN